MVAKVPCKLSKLSVFEVASTNVAIEAFEADILYNIGVYDSPDSKIELVLLKTTVVLLSKEVYACFPLSNESTVFQYTISSVDGV